MTIPLRWDLYCRVVDNYGDAGVCWRLAADLAGRGDAVRLFIDDAAPLAFMAPGGMAGVSVLPWPGPGNVHSDPGEPGDVVVEAFGCDLPALAVDGLLRAHAADRTSVWINLEYLSAEGYVERSHGLPSPQRDGLTKWFYYPGFSARTGGLLREPDLMARRQAFDRRAWLAGQGIATQPGERVVSLFCYGNTALPWLLAELARAPTLLLLTPGLAQAQVSQAPSGVRLHRLGWLSQHDFDHLLWASDLNFVRGEDSLVRALWAGVPFVWQIYPQGDAAHLAKLDAFLHTLQAPAALRGLHAAWNGTPPGPGTVWPDPQPWQVLCLSQRERLLAQADLSTRLRQFAAEKTGRRGL
jgi:uncharacterized repeat protein (TIGR03837 family)